MRRILKLAASVGFVVVFTVFAVVGAQPAEASFVDVVAQVAQETPYEPPEFTEVDLPGWAEPFEPLARLPLWAQAAFVSAAVAGLAFVVPVFTRWVWSLGDESERSDTNGE